MESSFHLFGNCCTTVLDLHDCTLALILHKNHSMQGNFTYFLFSWCLTSYIYLIAKIYVVYLFIYLYICKFLLSISLWFPVLIILTNVVFFPPSAFLRLMLWHHQSPRGWRWKKAKNMLQKRKSCTPSTSLFDWQKILILSKKKSSNGTDS